jgi:indolepyruvate ferredoxin oxidoreductase alpha subunit
LGIVSCGVAYQHAREVFPNASFLKLGMTYPLPCRLIADFAGRVERLIVVEEGDPILEEGIRLMGISVEGKSIFPLCGELSVQVVRASAIAAGLLPGSEVMDTVDVDTGDLPIRPPVLCPGCPHRPVFAVLRKLKLPVTGDIGCYTLGVMPPLSTIHTTGCMGASIGVAHGADKAGNGDERYVAVIGDSTFFHTGLPALLNVAYNHSRVITVIMDNRITAMTGHQEHPGTGLTLQGRSTPELDMERVVQALGVDRVHTVDSYDVEEVDRVFRECVEYDGPSVVITRRECALLPTVRKQYAPLRVDSEKCVACGTCLRTGCPALSLSDEVYDKTGKHKSQIDPLLCTGCEVCAQVCPKEAILFRHDMEGVRA